MPDGSVEWTLDAHGSWGRSTVGLADVSGDGLPDIIFTGRQAGGTDLSPIRAYDGFGNELWRSHDSSDNVYRFNVNNGAATLGKNSGDDFREGKITLPVVLAFRRGNDKERAFWRRVMEEGDQRDGGRGDRQHVRP